MTKSKSSYSETDAKALYELAEHWDADRTVSEAYREKVRLMNALIPEKAVSLLDVGCGDGSLTNQIDRCPRVVGADRSLTAVRRVKRNRVAASCDGLPFSNRSFDGVLCSQVLEHLPEPVYPLCLAELQRVANRWILLSVPFGENPHVRDACCADCGTIYNIWGHTRSFSSVECIRRLFPDFVLTTVTFSGHQHRAKPDWLVFVEQRLGRRWRRDEHSICPRCSSRNQANQERKWLTYFTDRLWWRLPIRANHWWIVCLFTRKEFCPKD